MLPQPYVFVAKGALPDLRVAVDLNQVWADLDNGSLMVTGVIIARKDFIEKNPEAVKAFLKEYTASTEYVNANVRESAVWVEKFDIFKAAVAEKAILLQYYIYRRRQMRAAMEVILMFRAEPQIDRRAPDDSHKA